MVLAQAVSTLTHRESLLTLCVKSGATLNLDSAIQLKQLDVELAIFMHGRVQSHYKTEVLAT